MQQQLSLYTVHGMKRSEPRTTARRRRRQLKGVRGASSPARWSMRRTSRTSSPKKLDGGRPHARSRRSGCSSTPASPSAPRSSLLLFGGEILDRHRAALLLGACPPVVLPVVQGVAPDQAFTRRLRRDPADHRRRPVRPVCSLPQAIDTVVKEGSRADRRRVHRAIIEQRLGVEIEDALETRRRADGEHRLQVGRHGDPHPARGRRQPGRAAAERCRHAARARVPAPSGAGAVAPRAGCPPGSSAGCRSFFVALPVAGAARRTCNPLLHDPLGWFVMSAWARAADRRRLLAQEGRQGGGVMMDAACTLAGLGACGIFVAHRHRARRRSVSPPRAARRSGGRWRRVEAIRAAPSAMHRGARTSPSPSASSSR